MARFVKIENEQDFLYLQNWLTNWNQKAKANISAFLEYADMFERLNKAFETAVQADEMSITKEISAPVVVPKVKKKRQGKTAKLNLCLNHPLYKALRAPRGDCEGCWSAFEKFAGRDRAKQAKAQQERKLRLKTNLLQQ